MGLLFSKLWSLFGNEGIHHLYNRSCEWESFEPLNDANET